MKTSKDSEDYLYRLRKAGYEVVRARSRNHWHIRWEGRMVAVHSGSPSNTRGLSNLKSRVRKFERENLPKDVDSGQPVS